MKFRKLTAVLSALCMMCAVVPVLPEHIQETVSITASANLLIEEEFTEGTYENMRYRKFADYIEICDLVDEEVTEINIPAEIDGLPVKKIGYLFGNLTTVHIPESVTEIVDHAFTNTPWLEAQKKESPLVTVNNILIDGTACTGDVIIPDNVTKIAPCAFEYCENITSVFIPEGVTSIGFNAFEGCSSLTSVTIPESVKHIGNRAFGGEMFSNTPWLEEKKKENPLVIVSDIVIDGTGCTGDVVIPEGVTAISGDAFRGCTEMTSVAIPDSVTEIGEMAFSDCSALTEIVIPDGVTVIEGFTFQECKGLTSVTIPDSVKSINSGAFLDCSALTSVELPENTTRIGFEAFSSSGLTSIVIPENVTIIRDGAFSGCSDLMSVTIKNPDCIIEDEGGFTISNEWNGETQQDNFNGTIYGYANSTAQAYAETYGYNFESLDTAEEIKPGDADGSGTVNILDVITVNKAVMGKDSLSDSQLKAVDFNQNQKPDSEEALTILKYIVGLVTGFTQ